MRVALVHDWLNQQGGAERVLLELHALFPNAPVHTTFYAPDLLDEAFKNMEIRTNWMQWLPGWRMHHQALLPFYPLAFGMMRVSNVELVISNASGFCKGIRTPSDTAHICYCLTPTRFVWTPEDYLAREGYPRLLLPALRPLLGWMRRWDRAAAQRVTQFVAISTTVSDRIRRYYGRDAPVIHPPVDTQSFAPTTEVEDYYLVVSRLIPYKRIDLAVQACTATGRSLVVIGEGRDMSRLRAMAGPSIRFLGRLSDAEVRRYMARCRAFIFPGEEDFGIAPVEAQAAGRPVVAFAGGGALDTVKDSETGVLFREPTAASLQGALDRADTHPFQTERLTTHAETFGREQFRSKMRQIVEQTMARTSMPTEERG